MKKEALTRLALSLALVAMAASAYVLGPGASAAHARADAGGDQIACNIGGKTYPCFKSDILYCAEACVEIADRWGTYCGGCWQKISPPTVS